MALILNIDTSSYNCSVALSEDDKIIAHTEIDSRSNTQALLTAIQQVLKDAGKIVYGLSAVVVNIGPGSYTGLRVGLAAAKGLCYTNNLPLLPVNGLTAMADYAIKQNKGKTGNYVIVKDNYRDGWYYGVYDEKLNSVSSPGSCHKIEEVLSTIHNQPVFIFGNSISKNDLPAHRIFLIPYFPITANHLAPLASLMLQNNYKFDLRLVQPLYINSIFSAL